MVDIPDPPFEDISAAELRDRLFDHMDSGLDQAEGSLAYNFLAPVAIELAQLYASLDQVVELSFIQSTYGQFLDARAEEHGLVRKPSSPASLTVEFTGTAGATVPGGTQVSTTVAAGSLDQAVIFATDEAAVVEAGGTVEVGATAIEDGLDGNVPLGSVTRILGTVANVDSVINTTGGSGGTDTESDEVLRQRLVDALFGFQGAGTADDYERWAQEVEGVGFASAEELWSGPGTVRVMILDSDRNAAGAALITAVEEHIEERRPIGADVTIATPTLIAINVVVNAVPEAGFTEAELEAGISGAVEAYIETLGPGDDVVRNEVGAAVVTAPGVADWTTLTLNGASTNTAIAIDEMATLNSVTVS